MDKIHDRSIQPFIIIDLRVLDLPVSEKAFRVYAQLKKYANHEGQCFPSYTRLGNECFYGIKKEASRRSAAMRAVAELIEVGLLEKTTNYKNNEATVNTYTLLDPANAIVSNNQKGGDMTSLGGDMTSLGGDMTSLGGDMTSPRTRSIELDPDELDPKPPYSPPEESRVERKEKKDEGGGEEKKWQEVDRSGSQSTKPALNSLLPQAANTGSTQKSNWSSCGGVQKTNKHVEPLKQGNTPEIDSRAEKTPKRAAKTRPMTDDELEQIYQWVANDDHLALFDFQNRTRRIVYWPWTTGPSPKSEYDRAFVDWVAGNKFSTTPENAVRRQRSMEWIRNRSGRPDNRTAEIIRGWFDYQKYLRERENFVKEVENIPKSIPPEKRATLEEADRVLSELIETSPGLAELKKKADLRKARRTS